MHFCSQIRIEMSTKTVILLTLTAFITLQVFGLDDEPEDYFNDDKQRVDTNENCLCPEKLPWSNYSFTEFNIQEMCGKELMYLVPNTTCVHEGVYSCKVNETKAIFDYECRMRYVHSPVYCAPTVLEECAQSKPVKKPENHMECLRSRSCDSRHRLISKLKVTYGKNAKKVCGNIPACRF